MVAPTALKPGKLHPFTGHDVPWLLRTRAQETPDRVFLLFAPFDAPAERWSYLALPRCRVADRGRARRARRRERRLRAAAYGQLRGVPARLACLLDPGAVVVTTNTRSSAEELSYFAEHCGAVAAITQPRYESMVRASRDGLRFVAVTVHDTGAVPETPRSPQALPFEALLEAEPAPARIPEPMLPNSVQYTSGTTSRPKGVVWTHANALWGARQNARNCQIKAGDVGHTCLPLYHTNALCYSHLATLWAGTTLVIQPRFSASRYWSCIVEHGCTWSVQIPFMLKALMTLPVPKAHKLDRWGLGAIILPSSCRSSPSPASAGSA